MKFKSKFKFDKNTKFELPEGFFTQKNPRTLPKKIRKIRKIRKKIQKILAFFEDLKSVYLIWE